MTYPPYGLGMYISHLSSPHEVLSMNPQYESGMATAVQAEPAKYCTEQSCIQVYTSSDREVQIISLTNGWDGLKILHFNFNLGYVSQHSHGKKTSL